MSINSITAAEHFSAIPLPDSIDHLTGPLPFRMTNDVLFHLLFETNSTALRGLICSLLNLKDSDIHSIFLKMRQDSILHIILPMISPIKYTLENSDSPCYT